MLRIGEFSKLATLRLADGANCSILDNDGLYTDETNVNITIEGGSFDGIYCDNGYTGVRLLSRGDAIRNIRITNIHGEFRFYAVSLTHHYPIRKDMPILLENIHISDVYASKSRAKCDEGQRRAVENGALIWFENGITCRNVTVEKVYRNERNTETKAPTVRISENVHGRNLVFGEICNTFVGEALTSVENNSDDAEVVVE